MYHEKFICCAGHEGAQLASLFKKELAVQLQEGS